MLQGCNVTLPKTIPLEDSDDPPPWLYPQPSVNLTLNALDKQQVPHDLFRSSFLALGDSYRNYSFLYTDASKTQEGTGSAIISQNEELLFRLPSYYSVYTGELYAIYQALLFILKNTGKKYAICSDSLNSILAIQKIYPLNPLLRMIRSKLHALGTQRKQLVLIYVPSHVGIVGNEMADSAAKRATTSPDSTTATLPTRGDTKNLLKAVTQRKWQYQWESSNAKLRTVKPDVNIPLRLPPEEDTR